MSSTKFNKPVDGEINELNSNLANKVDNNSVANLMALELSPGSSTAGHGGFIDFHFNGTSEDNTSRIIEAAPGNLLINGISITGLNNKVDNKTTASRYGAIVVSDYHQSGHILYFTIGNVCFVHVEDLNFKVNIAGSSLTTIATGLPVPKYTECFFLYQILNGDSGANAGKQAIRISITNENSDGVIKEHYSNGGFAPDRTYGGFFGYIIAD